MKFLPFILALGVSLSAWAQPSENTLEIETNRSAGKIDRNIYGQFAEHLGRCIYEGIWVGEDSPIPNVRGIRSDVVEALKKIKVPVLRWPGGCFADEYHWKNGIGPRAERPSMVNTNWGGVVENNHFGTHEFLDLCEQIGAEPYICGNVGSGTVQEMAEWVQYITSAPGNPMSDLRVRNGREKPWKLKYFGVGNENWGCGGRMRPEYYADVYRQYSNFVKNYDGNRVEKIACGANDKDYNWTDVVMSSASGRMNGLSLHYYTVPTGKWGAKGPAIGFPPDQWFSTMRQALEMDNLIKGHSEIMNRYDPEKKIAMIIDEWGTWYDATPGSRSGFLEQPNSLRDALVAAVTLNIFNAHNDRVKMANIAQTINVLQAMILTDKEKMILTPTYHVFEMFQVHQDAEALPITLKAADYRQSDQSIPAISASASKKDGVVHITLCNLDRENAATVHGKFDAIFKKVSGRVLTSDAIDAHNTFEKPTEIQLVDFTDFKLNDVNLEITLPPKSVVVLELNGA